MKNLFFKDGKINKLNPLSWIWLVTITLINIIVETIAGVIEAIKITLRFL